MATGKGWGREEMGGRDDWMASPTQWTWVWTNSEREWRTGKPSVLQSMRSQTARHNRETEQQQQNEHSNLFLRSIWWGWISSAQHSAWSTLSVKGHLSSEEGTSDRPSPGEELTWQFLSPSSSFTSAPFASSQVSLRHSPLPYNSNSFLFPQKVFVEILPEAQHDVWLSE